MRHSSQAGMDSVHHIEQGRPSQVREDRARDPDYISPDDILASIADEIHAAGLVRELPPNTDFWRARNRSHGPRFLDGSELGPAPRKDASANRMTAAGVPAFYAARDIATAIAEIDNPDAYSAGRFRTLRALSVLDLSQLPSFPSIFDLNAKRRLLALRFLCAFAVAVAKPIHADRGQHVGYAPTQAFATYMREMYGPRTGVPIDGILYQSSRRTGGECVVIFGGSEMVCDDPLVPGLGQKPLLALLRTKHRDHA
ncbi:MAG: RES family NAD+ phosphorylase [Dehalococcoidia bacterium]